MLQTDNLRRAALILVSIGLAWNLVEVVIAFWAGARVGSVALFAFGLDSIIEVFAGGVLVWRLRKEGEEHENEAAERRAQRLVGITFFVLAGYVGLHAVVSLGGWLPEPQPSLAGIGIAVASAVVMSILYVAKMRIAARMQSRALRAEAMESLFCDLQDLAILVGLGFNFLLSWWWADPVAALLLIHSSSRKAWRISPGTTTMMNTSVSKGANRRWSASAEMLVWPVQLSGGLLPSVGPLSRGDRPSRALETPGSRCVTPGTATIRRGVFQSRDIPGFRLVLSLSKDAPMVRQAHHERDGNPL